MKKCWKMDKMDKMGVQEDQKSIICTNYIHRYMNMLQPYFYCLEDSTIIEFSYRQLIFHFLKVVGKSFENWENYSDYRSRVKSNFKCKHF